MIEEIRHIGIVAEEIDRSISFYREYLGFEIEKDAHEQGPFIDKILGLQGARLRTVKMKAPTSPVMVELIDYLNGDAVPGDNRINRIGPTHFAVTVEAIDDKYTAMKSRGVSFISGPENSPDNYARVAFCRAPEGTYIEMVEIL